jgi:hypothetical protein
MIDLRRIASEVKAAASELGWRIEKTKIASTGTVYIDLVRDQREWVVIRVADHKQQYYKWLTTYSLSPYEYSFEEIIDILEQPFGETGDVLL